MHPSTASLVTEAAQLLRTVGPPITLVVNRMPAAKQVRIDLDGLERLVPDAHGLICVDENQAAAARVAAGQFGWDDAPDGWARQLRELAVVLQSDWPALGLAHA